MLTKNDIHGFLQSIGIKPTDTVLVHTSMKCIGEVDGGCDGLIDGFTSYLTDGLFIVPTHTWSMVNKDAPVYDVRATVPNIGALPTVAAFRKDGVRSLQFGVYEDAFAKCGALTFGKLGNAEVGVFDAVRGTEVIKLLWKNAEYDLTLEPQEIPESYYKELMV